MAAACFVLVLPARLRCDAANENTNSVSRISCTSAAEAAEGSEISSAPAAVNRVNKKNYNERSGLHPSCVPVYIVLTIAPSMRHLD